jgi:HAD superfamily hydrolase (TIGR01509 family)
VEAARGFLLDFDGVLADSEPWYYRSWSETLAPLGIHVEPAEYWLYWTSRGEGLDGFYRRHGLAGMDSEGLHARQKAIYAGFCSEGRIPLFPGAVPLLEALARNGRPFAIASNTGRSLVESILQKASAPVPLIVGGEGLPHKPSPAIFLKAAGALGLPPGDVLVLEDAEKGIRAARAGGFPCVLVWTDINRGLVMDASADYEIDGLGPLAARLGRGRA